MQNQWDGLITFLGTNDLDKTHEFYNKLLGLELYKDQGLCRIYNVAEGGKIGFCCHMDVVLGDKSPIITLLTPHVDTAYENLKNQGYEVIKEPKINTKFNIYHFFIKDPNSYTVEIQKFLD